MKAIRQSTARTAGMILMATVMLPPFLRMVKE